MLWLFIVAGLAFFVWDAVKGKRKRPATGRASGQLPERYRYRGMLLLVGIPGSGKTYKMLDMMLRSLADGRHVRVNFNVRYERIYIALRRRYRLSHEQAKVALGRIGFLDTFEDLIDAYSCDVYIDEAQDYLSAQDWQIYPPEAVTWMAQHRHRLCRVVLACHRFGSIHSYVRELLADIHLARPAPWWIKPFYFMFRGSTLPLLQYISIKDQEEEVMGGKPKPRKGFSTWFNLSFVPLDPIIGDCYDTHGGVRPSPLTQLRRDRSKHDLGLDLKPRREVRLVSSPAPLDDQPYLGLGEYLDTLADAKSDPAHVVLAERWAHGAA